jgi:hypothetical protein
MELALGHVDRINFVLEVSRLTKGKVPFQNLCRKEKVSVEKLHRLGYSPDACKAWEDVNIHSIDSISQWFKKYSK